MQRQPDNIFDDLGLVQRNEGVEAIYQASRVRDEAEVIRKLDAHREQYGEPEQVAYAHRAEHRQDDAELGKFPYAKEPSSVLQELNHTTNYGLG